MSEHPSRTRERLRGLAILIAPIALLALTVGVLAAIMLQGDYPS
ncbi:hypothetical protein AB0L82_10905 [Nocardia sp. NPDC052001]